MAIRSIRRSLLTGLFFALTASAAAAPEETAPPAAPTTEERLSRLEEELSRTRAELESLRREGAGASPASGTPTSAPAAASPTADLSKYGMPVEVRAAFGKGFTITTVDDSFSVQVRARVQIRFTESASPEDDSLSEYDTASEFQVRRLRLLFQGHALTRDLTYYIQLGFSNLDTESDLRLPLRDAYVNWAALRDLNIRAGQMKVPFNRQRVNSSSALQMVDRSLVQAELNLDRDVGVKLWSPDLFGLGNLLVYHLGVYGGDGRNRLSAEPGVLLVGRLQLQPFGKFDDDVEADLDRSDKPRLAIGTAAAWNENTNRQRSTFGNVYKAGTTDYVHVEGDVHFKWSGLSLQAEVLYRKSDDAVVAGIVDDEPVSEETRSGWGFFTQAGYMLTDSFELAARYGELRPVGSRTAVPFEHETGGGASYYFDRHNLKLQADYFYIWDAHFAGGGHVVRVQLQLYF